MHKKIALIDGYGFVFRAYHSLPPLTRADGTPVGAVYGFTNMLIKLLAGLDVTHAAVVFDSGSKTFRNDIYPAYKTNRPPCPEDLKPQFSIVREAAESINLAILEKAGFEADDLIATIAKKSSENGYEVLIVSSDKDLMQLVNERVSMYDAMKNKIITDKEVKEKFFVTPNKVLDILSLMGDSSDNIPGVKGIGPKTAAELIEQFGNLENIFSNLHKIKQEKRRQLLTEGIENARLSKILASLKDDVELGIGLEDLQVKSINPHKLLQFLEKQGFRSLASRVKKEFNISETINHEIKIKKEITKEIAFKDIKQTEILTIENLNKLTEQALVNGTITIDYQIKNNELNFLTFSTCKNEGLIEEIFFCNLSKIKNFSLNQNYYLFNTELGKHENKGFVLNWLEEILNNNSIKKIFFDAKEFLKTLEFNKKIIFDDVALINHLLNSSIRNDLRDLISLNLSDDIESSEFGIIFDEIEKNRIPEIFSNSEKKAEFFSFKNFAIYKLYKILSEKISELKLNTTYKSYELPLLGVLAKIENNGIKIDIQKLAELSEEFSKKINLLTKEIYALAGEEFNIASPKQLAEILFTKLSYNSNKKSKKTGALSTNSEVLEELAFEGHEIATKILDFRKFSKLKNTYTDSLPKQINPKTGRIHTHFSSIATVTGRLSSSNPNLQNIPIRTIEGQKIRDSFIAPKNHLLISADYSQIELRVIAHVAKITNLINAFKEGKDIHQITASQVFNISEDKVDDNLRSKAKAINFGIIYGISAFGLARQLDIPKQEAAIYIKSYLEAYPGIDNYMKKYIEFAHNHGYVETISGRKCFLHEINNKNPMIRAESERLAINAPIQGSAADIIKKAMIRLDKKLTENNFSAKIILQIHDELIIEAPEIEIENVSQLIKSEMENAMILDTPLKVDIKIGKTWK